MSRSYRKAIIKDKPKNYKISQFANRIIRRVESGYVRSILSLADMESYNIPSRVEIFNAYDYCDYRFVPEYKYSNKDKSEQNNIDHVNKLRRK